MKNIVWLASYPKSGNTWLRAFLSNYLSEKNKAVSINQLVGTPIASSRALFEHYVGISSSLMSPAEYDSLRPDVYMELSRDLGEMSFHKVHDAYRLLSNDKALFPSACSKAAVYIIRDPKQVCLSLKRFGDFETINQVIDNMNDPKYCLGNDQKKTFSQLRQQVFDWSTHVKSWTTQNEIPCLLIRYEDMLTHTESVFKKVLDHIGISVDQAKLLQAIEFSSLKELSYQEKAIGFNERPVSLDNFFNHPDISLSTQGLTARQREQLWHKNKDVMYQYGYEK